MASSLVRGRYVVCSAPSRTEARVIEDGAVFQRDGRIVEVGPYPVLAAKHRPDEVIGSPDHVVMPGLINSHHHVGLTPFQLGAPDLHNELWKGYRMTARTVDPYLDTLYSAFEMIESGVTTVQHMQSRVDGPVERISGVAGEVIRAYRDIGMRVSYSYLVVDQNRLVHGADEDFLGRLPADLATEMADLLRTQSLPLEAYFQLFEGLHERHNTEDRVRIQLAPANLQWCSDRCLLMFKEYAEGYRVPMHMHLLETPYEKMYANRRARASAVQHLHDLGLLGPNLTLGHAVWVSEHDIELAAETGTHICHNPSSNLRLRNGVAPLNAFARLGVRVAIGIDEAGINDDRDMLQEMRLVLNLHREPGMDDDVPTAPQVFRMATEHGAQTTPYGHDIGTLEPGKAADMVVLDWRRIAHPYLDEAVPVVDAIVHRARSAAVETVIVGGEPILRDSRFTRLDKDRAIEELAASLRVPLRPEEVQRRRLSKKILPELRRFYDGYLDDETRDPFYRPNSRH